MKNRYKVIINYLNCALFFLFISSNLYAASLPPVSSQRDMVVTAQYLATKVGVAVLKQGGNAIDAAVAAGYALAVVDPCCGNIGGGGFMLIHFANGKTTMIDFREKAPAALRASLFLDKKDKPIPGITTHGYLPVGIPGTVMGLNYALQKYGTLPLRQVMQPAIDLANRGFILQAGDARILAMGTKDFQQQPNVAAIFLKNNQALQAGDKLVQSDLANTLQLIAQQGTQAFYQGPIAQQIVKASQQHGGIITSQDLAGYEVKERIPVRCDYRGYQVISAVPPSSGGVTLCEMLQITQHYPLASWGYHSAQGVHYIIEAMRYAYADRNEYLGDPDFVNNPIDYLLSAPYINKINKAITADKVGDSSKIGFKATTGREGNSTTHYSIVDRYGNAVAVTYTIDDYFGSRVIANKTGFFLNNEMDDFALQPNVPNIFGLVQGEANKIRPGARPLSSTTPTIIMHHGKLFMVLGSPGGSTITTQVLQTMENVIDYGMNIQEAVDAPRFHMQWLPDVVYVEPYTFSPDTLAILQKMGYHFQLGSPYKTKTWGVVAAILRDPTTGTLYGAIDSRQPQGSAAGE